MKKSLIIGGSLALGAVGLWLWNKRQAANADLGVKAPNNSMGSGPRVDNKSQPWYHGATDFLKSKADEIKSNPTAALNNFGSVIQNTSSIWGTVSGFFGGGDSTNTVDIPDANPSPIGVTDGGVQYSSDGSDPTEMPSSELDQSDMIGSQVGQDTSDFVPVDVNQYDDPTAEDAMVGSDNSDFSFSA